MATLVLKSGKKVRLKWDWERGLWIGNKKINIAVWVFDGEITYTFRLYSDPPARLILSNGTFIFNQKKV